MKVEQVMTKQVSTCGRDDTLNDAARIMWERDCGFVPITERGANPRVVGIVTDRDVCIAAYTRGRALREIRIGDVMSTGVRTCKPSDALATAEATMRQIQVHRLPVVDDADQLLGVVSLADIAREAAREVRSSRREVTPAEIGETLAAICRARELPASAAP
jgi:CBS domain-containing protein